MTQTPSPPPPMSPQPPPPQPQMTPPMTPSGYVACPRCGGQDIEKLGFTWWGGVLGPKLLTHVKCGGCGVKYNGKTGGSNDGAIAIYFIVVGLIAFGLIMAIT